MICKKCGAKIGDTDRFCPSCGEPQLGDKIPRRRQNCEENSFRSITRTIMIASLIIFAFSLLIRQPRIMVIAAASSLTTFMVIKMFGK